MLQEASLPQKFTGDYSTLGRLNAIRSNNGHDDSCDSSTLGGDHIRSKGNKKDKEKIIPGRSNRHPTVAPSSTTITAIEDEFIMTRGRVVAGPREPSGMESFSKKG